MARHPREPIRTRRPAWPILSLVLAVALGGPRSAAQQPAPATAPAVREGLIDLVSRLDTTQVSPHALHAVTREAVISDTDPRPGVAFVRTSQGNWVIFPELSTRGPTRLRFEIGVATPKAPASDQPVRFAVDVNTRRDPTWRRIFTRSLRPSQLPPGRLLEAHEVPLPGAGPALRSVRLSVAPGEAGGPPLSWPGWSCPQLIFEGPPDPLPPLRLPDAGLDLLTRTQASRGDASPALHPMDPAPGVELVGGEHPALRLDAPARATWAVRIPATGMLLLELGVDAVTSWHLGGGEVEFAVQVDGRPVRTLSLDPARRQRDRGWKTLRVDLQAWAGRRVTLGLSCAPGQRPGPDVLGISRALLLDERQIPRLPASAAPSVVLIVADTLRADAPGPATPAITRLADAGLAFSAARSVASWTWPATASLLTGTDPAVHRLLDASHPVISRSVTSLAQLLAARGYTTGGFAANALISAQSGLQRGFERFVLLPNARAGTLNERVAAWLGETDGNARLLYVHYMDPHAPYLPAGPLDAKRGPLQGQVALSTALESALRLGADHPATASLVDRLRSAYAGEVTNLDRGLGRLLELLDQHGVLDDALVVFVADHGEEFLEHGAVNHGWHLFDETLAVPLRLAGFGASALAPARIDTPVSTRDLLPTLCELLGLEAPAGCARPWPLAAQPAPTQPPLFSQTLLGREHGVDHAVELDAVVWEGHKLIWAPESGSLSLFDLERDPGEQVDLAPDQPQRAQQLLGLLRAWRERGPEPASQGPDDEALAEARRLLQQLGYLGR